MRALEDLTTAVVDLDSSELRLIGGHMVSLHVRRCGLDLYRLTADADLGVPPFLARTGGVIERLEALGYERLSGNRYGRVVDETRPDEKAIVDILVPAYTSRPKQDLRISKKLTTIEVPGLAEALLRDPVELEVSLEYSDRTRADVMVTIPDQAAALCLKLHAWDRRTADKDAVDIWRMLEVFQAEGLGPIDEYFEGDSLASLRRIAVRAFDRSGGPVLRQTSGYLKMNAAAATSLHTRLKALADRFVLPPQRG